MFGWLKRWVQIKAASMREKDIDRFLLGLRGMPDSEIGGIVAIAAHWRNALEAQFGWNLDHPDFVAAQDVAAALKINRMIREVQKSNPAMASGLMVWLHSIRASETPEIRLRGREMWAELERGFPFVWDAAEGFTEFGMNLNIRDFECRFRPIADTHSDASRTAFR